MNDHFDKTRGPRLRLRNGRELPDFIVYDEPLPGAPVHQGALDQDDMWDKMRRIAAELKIKPMPDGNFVFMYDGAIFTIPAITGGE